MKRPLACAFAFVALSTSSWAAALDADSQIVSATVYRDRAVITRVAHLDVSSGVQEIVFSKLPPDLLAQSLQASGRGTAAATILDVIATPQFVEAAVNERVKALEDQIRGVARDERALADRKATLKQQQDYVRKIETATTTPTKDGPSASATPADTWTKLLAFSDEQLTRLAKEQQSLDDQTESLQAKRTALEQQLNELRGQGGRSYQRVVVRVDATAAGAMDVTLRYAVAGASWTPSYDARVSTADHRVEVGYFGIVQQHTGEDWRQVDLTLSTAQPSLGGQAPELQPWVVQQRVNEEETIVLSPFSVDRKRTVGAAPVAAARTRTDLKDEASSISVVTSQALTTVTQQATSATFHIAAKTDVPSDNAPHKVGIASVPLAATLTYATTPKLVPAAFLTAEAVNSSDYPLLAGPMSVFLDDAFVASSELKSVMPGEKVSLALGADEGITVKRKLNNRFTEDTGLVNKGHRITYNVTITVENHKRTPEKITVTDQVPVSRHEKIVVKVLAPEANEAKPDAAGVLKWNLSLNPGEKRELPLKVSVEYPADMDVAGLE